MRIAVCDDNRNYAKQIKAKIESIYHSLDIIIDIYHSGTDLLRCFKKQAYDMVFMDIEMPEINGISVAKSLRKVSEKVWIVFLTSHIEYALEGYEVNALRYLTKPVSEDMLREIINYVIDKEKSRRFLWIKTEDEEVRVDIEQIVYMEAQNQNVIIYTKEQEYTVRYNIKDYECELQKEGFFRIHRGYLVALGKVKKVAKREVVLQGDIALPVSRTREKELKEVLYQFIKEEAM